MFRRKRQKYARFMDDALETRSIKIFKCWNSVIVFPSPNKISGYAPGSMASIYQKILCFAFDLIYVVILLVAVYFVYRNWPSLDWLSQFLSIIVSI